MRTMGVVVVNGERSEIIVDLDLGDEEQIDSDDKGQEQQKPETRKIKKFNVVETLTQLIDNYNFDVRKLERLVI